jgi:hypothetical protein
MSASRAKAIVTSTAMLAMKPEMSLPGCPGGRANASRWVQLNPSGPDLERPDAVLTPGSMETIVDYGFSLRFHFDKNDRAVCWDELIVVD